MGGMGGIGDMGGMGGMGGFGGMGGRRPGSNEWDDMDFDYDGPMNNPLTNHLMWALPKPLRPLVKQGLIRMASGASAAEMTELSFLPLSTREYLRQVWDYASTS